MALILIHIMDNTVPSTNISLNYNAVAGRPLKRIEALNQRKKWLGDNNWNDITPGRELPSNIKYMVVDIETHDWLPDHLVKDDDKDSDELRYGTGRIVEIAWMLFNVSGECLESKRYLIKPYGTYKEIAIKATEVHGITTERASKHGVDVKLVLSEFIHIVKNIPKDGFVIAHNMAHEHTVLTNSFSPDQRGAWNVVQKSDTHSVPLLKYLPHEAKVQYEDTLRRPSLKGFNLLQLYECLFGSDKLLRDYAHFADTDVRMTWDVFQYYKQHATIAQELVWKQAVKEQPFRNWKEAYDYNVRRLRLPPLSSTVKGRASV